MPMERLLFPLEQDDDQVLRNQNMVLLLLSGPQCNAVFWRIGNRCVELLAIMAFLMRQYVVLFLLVAKKMLDEFFSVVCVDRAYGKALLQTRQASFPLWLLFSLYFVGSL